MELCVRRPLSFVFSLTPDWFTMNMFQWWQGVSRGAYRTLPIIPQSTDAVIEDNRTGCGYIKTETGGDFYDMPAAL